MRIALLNPRKVHVPLKDSGKRNGHHHVYTSVRPFLKARGWTISGAGNAYLSVNLPLGVKKPFRLTVEIPTQEQVAQLADELFAARQEWSGYLGEWWAFYYPPEHHGGR